MSALAALCGVGVAAGVLVLLGAPGPTRRLSRLSPARRQVLVTRAALGVGAAVLLGALTGWPVGAVLGGLAAAALPGLVGGRRAGAAAIARTEAVAAWAEMLRDTMAGAAGLEQAITATAPVAPSPVRAEVCALALQLAAGEGLAPALRAFAGALGDPTGDLVVAALVLAAERHAQHLGELLGSVAAAARDEAGMRLRVDAGRARTRTAVRVVSATTLVMALGLVVVDRGYLAPYDSALGQAVLGLVGLCFAGALGWLRRMARVATPERLLAPEPTR